MLFNSYIFLFAFLPVVLAGWWLLPSKSARLGFLSLASYVFYGWWDYRFVPLMLFSSTADFAAGWLIARSRSQAQRRAWLVLLLVVNLGVLALFKYYDFGAGTLNRLAALAGSSRRLGLLHLVLPVGISFYTFNSISYTIDIYRGRIAPAKNLLEFSTFVAMFPHLVAGPIVRYSDMAEQFAELRARPRSGELVLGVWFLVLGMAKKVLIADVIAESFVTPAFAHVGSLGLCGSWLGVFAYTMQIYFDFSGYSDMAVGLAYLLGLRFPQNFNSPYQARNISIFWRRWHMSLSFWLRDYLYIPLGGSRGGPARTAVNLGLTMLLGGLWHGASFTFVAWGLYHGVLLAVHALAERRGWVPRSDALSTAITFVCVMLGWVFFRSPDFSTAGQMLTAMAGARGVEPGAAIWALVRTPATAILVLAGALAFAAPNTWQLRYPRTRWAAAVLAVLLAACTLQFAHPSPFLYFQF